MAEPKHTAGPWDWLFADGRRIALVSDDGAVDVLLSTGDGERAWAEVSGRDAEVIEAAPDLLAACRRFVAAVDTHVYRYGGTGLSDGILAATNAAREAIGTAEGE